MTNTNLRCVFVTKRQLFECNTGEPPIRLAHCESGMARALRQVLTMVLKAVKKLKSAKHEGRSKKRTISKGEKQLNDDIEHEIFDKTNNDESEESQKLTKRVGDKRKKLKRTEQTLKKRKRSQDETIVDDGIESSSEQCKTSAEDVRSVKISNEEEFDATKLRGLLLKYRLSDIHSASRCLFLKVDQSDPSALLVHNIPPFIAVVKYVSEYRKAIVSPDELQQRVDKFFEVYDKKVVEEKRKAKKMHNVPDEEGWITVTRSRFKPVPAAVVVKNKDDLLKLTKNKKKLTPLGKYGGRHTVTVLPGDGIGPEMVSHLERIFRFANVPVDFEEVPLTTDSGQDDFEHALVSVKRNGVALKGNIETQFDDPSFTSRNVELRRRLDLFANVLHCSSIPTIRSKHQNIDIVLIRENTEGEYSGLEHEAVHGVVESIKIITRYNIERIARFAFEYALLNNRKRVTCIHKANIQKLGDGLFLQVCREMASREYPSIQLDSMIVDNASMQLVSKPQQFDVMLMPNLYGNIISNIACGLVGGPGLVSGINIGCKYAVFETGTRNTGKELAGKDLANPTAFLCAGVDMLRYLHLQQHADLISNALFKVGALLHRVCDYIRALYPPPPPAYPPELYPPPPPIAYPPGRAYPPPPPGPPPPIIPITGIS
ncbi:unnamed protein product [Anisakis simplex]|uniref:Isocitrate dehydrogenase [NAD] subunit, mitochondrial n=1 Tax=Anisakis simplex TaxID=6269 RepID=A0A0M3K1H4_ANISI|nr:unnamed protein product [Anisakis simplex]